MEDIKRIWFVVLYKIDNTASTLGALTQFVAICALFLGYHAYAEGYSIQIRKPDSKYWSGFNLVDPEVEAKIEGAAIYEQQERDSKPLYKSGKR